MSTILVQIDEMKESDLSAVRNLSEQLGYQEDILVLTLRFHVLANSQDHKLFVARNKDQKGVEL